MTSSTPQRSETPEQVLDRLDFTVLRRLDGIIQGEYRSAFRGGGLDFTDLRDYQADDDVRHIDWNVTARLNQPFVRQYIEEREITVWFLLDNSPSMHVAPPGDSAASKHDLARDTAASLARLFTRAGNRVGLVLWNSSEVEVVKARGGRNHVLHLVSLMGNSADTPDGTPTRLADLGHQALASIGRRSLVFVVSDFLSEPGWEQSFAALAQRHDLIGVRVVDPAEHRIPDGGLLVFEDAETGAQLEIDTSDQAFRERYVEVLAQHDSAIKDSAARVGLDLHELSTEDELLRFLVALVRVRKARRR